jgi:hypothetical protein
MDNVTVVFTNGNIVSFDAHEFEVDLSTGNKDIVQKYPYKDAQGHDSFVHLEPNEVAGVFLTRAAHRNAAPISYTVANSR